MKYAVLLAIALHLGLAHAAECPTIIPREERRCTAEDLKCIQPSGEIVEEPAYSCFGRCGEKAEGTEYKCNCHEDCQKASDSDECCEDYLKQCPAKPSRPQIVTEPLNIDEGGACLEHSCHDGPLAVTDVQTTSTTAATTRGETKGPVETAPADPILAPVAQDAALLEADYKRRGGERSLFYTSPLPEPVEWDYMCQGVTNHAPSATASVYASSSYNAGTGPMQMQDEEECGWTYSVYRGPNTIFQYDWDEPVLIKKMHVVTDPQWNDCGPLDICGQVESGRGVTNGTVEYYDGSNWIPIKYFTNTDYRFEIELDEFVYTEGIRLGNIYNHPCYQYWHPIIYEWAVCDHIMDNLCGADTNLAPFATASGWGNQGLDNGAGGWEEHGYGPSEMQDGHPCNWYWPEGNKTNIMYEWDSPINFDRFHLMTDPECESLDSCATHSAGRGINMGEVQYYDVATRSWISDGEFVNTEATMEYVFNSGCITSTKIRIINMMTYECNVNQFPPIIYEWSVCCCQSQSSP